LLIGKGRIVRIKSSWNEKEWPGPTCEYVVELAWIAGGAYFNLPMSTCAGSSPLSTAWQILLATS
jgi:hypothetical protein